MLSAFINVHKNGQKDPVRRFQRDFRTERSRQRDPRI